MSRVKTFDATGIAPGGKLYAGDLNSIQDQYADLTNYAQNHGVGTLAVGDASLQLLKFGTGEMRLTGNVRTDGIMRGLGGVFAGQFTTAQRDAMAAGTRPYGLIILNTTDNELQWNVGSDATPDWMSVAMRGDGIHAGHAIIGESAGAGDDVLTVRQVGNAQGRWIVEAGGKTLWGSGSATPDVELSRSAVGELEMAGRMVGVRPAGQQVYGAKDAADTIHRFWIGSDGSMEWGPGGVAARDVRISRPAANHLKLEDLFETASLRVGATGTDINRVKIVSVTADFSPNIPGGQTDMVTVTLPAGSCDAGDNYIYIGSPFAEGLTLTQGDGVAAVDNQVKVRMTNLTGSGINPAAFTLRFLILGV